jgi:hypothetical protein
MKKNYEKPKVSSLSVKGLTLHGAAYAPNESVGSYEFSPSNKNKPDTGS